MRVNIDEKMLSDPRFKKLGHRLRISYFEVFGRVLPVWNMAYHRRDALMAGDDIDALAELEGFAMAMVAVDLATETEYGHLRLRGVETHIRWLLDQDHKRELANDARRAKREVPREAPRAKSSRDASPGTSRGKVQGEFPREAPGEFPDQEQDLSPDLDLLPPELPDRSVGEISSPARPPQAVNGSDPRAIGRLAIELWRGVSADRLSVATELGLAGVLPLPECDSPTEPGAFRELRTRLREEGANAALVCKHVRAALLERARADKSIEWLAEKAFTEGGWRTARSYVLGAAKRARPGDPSPTMRLVRRDDDAPPPTGGET